MRGVPYDWLLLESKNFAKIDVNFTKTLCVKKEEIIPNYFLPPILNLYPISDDFDGAFC